MRDVFAAALALSLMFTGAAISWPLARRAGIRAHERDLAEIERIGAAMIAGAASPTEAPVPGPAESGTLRRPTYDTTVLDLTPIQTGHVGYRGRRRLTRWDEVRAWYASTAPRDVDAPVRAALASPRAGRPVLIDRSPLVRLAPGWRDRTEPIPVMRLFGQPTDAFAAVAS
jgi:hypothetical protein